MVHWNLDSSDRLTELIDENKNRHNSSMHLMYTKRKHNHFYVCNEKEDENGTKCNNTFLSSSKKCVINF